MTSERAQFQPRAVRGTYEIGLLQTDFISAKQSNSEGCSNPSMSTNINDDSILLVCV